jgi:histone acetyltransferase (RNA polymerase elongator complex component)
MAEFEFEKFLEVMSHAVLRVPPWTRINRVHRDFPEAQVKNGLLGFVSDNIKSNLQEVITERLAKQGLSSVDIRAREIKNQQRSNIVELAQPFVRCYRASGGTELFLSVEISNDKTGAQPDNATLLGLLR